MLILFADCISGINPTRRFSFLLKILNSSSSGIMKAVEYVILYTVMKNFILQLFLSTYTLLISILFCKTLHLSIMICLPLSICLSLCTPTCIHTTFFLLHSFSHTRTHMKHREWTDEGQLWVQYVSSTPATRLDVVNLQVTHRIHNVN